MYNEEIKKLLIKNFGEPKNSLSIGAKSRNNNLRIYHYKLSNEKEINEFLFVVNNMTKESISKFKELINVYDKKERYISETCACYSESDDGWEIEFYSIKEIKYRKTVGKTIAAFIKLDNKPLAVLKEVDADILYGLFGRPNYISERAHRQESEGMSYWINKYMYLNESFRSFIVDFLYLLGKENYIYNDVARTIENTHCFLPEINHFRLMLCNKPSEIFDALNIDYKKFNINPNKIDINKFYIFSQVLPYIHKLDYKLLFSINSEMIIKLIDAEILFNGMTKKDSIANFISNFYIYNKYSSKFDLRKHKKYVVGIRFSIEDSMFNFAKDYAISCIDLNEPIRLIYNDKQLVMRHDRLAIALRRKVYIEEKDLPLIAVFSKFDALENKIQNNYPNMFKRICSIKELYDEGEYQCNCVFSRKQMIRNDLVSIYHWNYHDKDFTIQFSIDLNGRYQIDEIKGRFNKLCEKEDKKVIDEIVDDINKKVV